MSEFKVVEESKDLLRDMHSKAIINTNRSAYLAAVERANKVRKSKDELRDATREINILKQIRRLLDVG